MIKILQLIALIIIIIELGQIIEFLSKIVVG